MARITPSTGPGPGLRRRNTAANTGANTTNRPVTKPAFDARVYWSPTVWDAYPAKSASPATSPARRPSRESPRTCRPNTAVITTAASVKRSARNSNGGTRCTASFTTGNVTPHTAATATRASAYPYAVREGDVTP